MQEAETAQSSTSTRRKSIGARTLLTWACIVVIMTGTFAFLFFRTKQRTTDESVEEQASHFTWHNLLSNQDNWQPWLSGEENDHLIQAEVFRFKKNGAQHILHISGQRSGGIATRKEFKDYHLTVDYRWGSKVWPRNKSEGYRDSGILIHCFGKQGEAYRNWMKSVEFQLQENREGALWVLHTLAEAPVCKTRVASGSMEYQFSPDYRTELITECAYSSVQAAPIGQWNQAEIYCIGEQAVFLLNGEVSMLITSMRKAPEDGGGMVKEGAIQLQSDGAEIFFRDLKIRPIKTFPIKFTEMFEKISVLRAQAEELNEFTQPVTLSC